MANPEHLKIIEHGAATWNEWRRSNPNFFPDLEGADLRPMNLRGANMMFTRLRGADMSGLDLEGSSFAYADAEGVFLGGATMIHGDLRHVNLIGARMRNVDLCEADLEDSNLASADLSGAELSGAKLVHANLAKANLRHVLLDEANASFADFSHANLNEANLIRATLKNSILNGADMSGAFMLSTMLLDCDLSNAFGLDLIIHRGPSHIDVDTLYRSNGNIPNAFLRGVGVPDLLIEYIPSFINAQEPIRFYSSFISYSSKDEPFTKRLHARMQQEHLRVWFAPEDMKGGEKTHVQIDEAIRIHDKLLLVLSEHSMSSNWVKTEIRKAHNAEIREKRQKLFPIRLVDFETIKKWECFDSDNGEDLAALVREYHIPDFSRWKDHDSFERGFAKLLKDLKANGVAGTGSRADHADGQ